MQFTGSDENKFKNVHPDLVRVLRKAAEITTIPFFISQTLRTAEEAYTNFGKGRNAAACILGGCPVSYSRPNEAIVTNVACALNTVHYLGIAVDMYFVGFSFNPNKSHQEVANDTKTLTALSVIMKQAAKLVNVRIEWGGDWEPDIIDRPHYELVTSD